MQSRTGRIRGFRVVPILLSTLWCALMPAGLLLAGCSSADKGPSASGSSKSSSSAKSDDGAKLLQEVEERHVIGPAAARELEYRIDWQQGNAGEDLKSITAQADSVFVLDGRNFLSRLRLEDGQPIWRAPVSDPVEELLGITFIPGMEKVYVTTGGALLVLDAATGSQVGKQPFEKIANTAPVVYNQFMIYGSRNGQLIWHSYPIAYQWRGYQVAQAIQVPPVLSDGFLVAAGNDGTVITLLASSATQLWNRKLLDKVVCQPTVGKSAVYVAGTDQHLRAFDLNNGRPLWKVLTESPLTESPTLLGDFVYQQIPSQGLACFRALPIDSPGGERVWTTPGVKGSVIGKRRENLMVWDPEGKEMTVLDAKRGNVVKTVALPQVKSLVISSLVDGDLFAFNEDGRVIHLVAK